MQARCKQGEPGSYVLGIEARPGKLVVRLDLMRDPGHPNFGPPLGDDRACFRPALLCFDAVRGLTWTDQGTPQARNANGEIDYGAIDEFTWTAGEFALVGDWGRIQVNCHQPRGWRSNSSTARGHDRSRVSPCRPVHRPAPLAGR